MSKPVMVCFDCDCEQMLGGCQSCREAQRVAGRSPYGPRPVADTPFDADVPNPAMTDRADDLEPLIDADPILFAAALLRAAGWRVEEPSPFCYPCEDPMHCAHIGTCAKSDGSVRFPTCVGTGKRP